MTTTSKSLDRETVSNYSLTVTACRAAGVHGPCLQSTQNISLSLFVDVLDDNDNSPQFDELSYSATLASDTPVGSRIAQLTAVDQDAPGRNSLVTYRLQSVSVDGFAGGRQLLGVDALTGWISVTDRLSDVERAVVLSVVAHDHGQPRRSTTTRVHLTVVRRPHITSPPDNATVLVQQVRVT